MTRRSEHLQIGDVAEHEGVRFAIERRVRYVAGSADGYETFVSFAVVTDDVRLGEVVGIGGAAIETEPAFRFAAVLSSR